ncbi:MAG: hypothetical protein MMC33_004026 [Icmadophila ericetorum]|nr:hypothetical protein [Icmadophila ericetorum]
MSAPTTTTTATTTDILREEETTPWQLYNFTTARTQLPLLVRDLRKRFASRQKLPPVAVSNSSISIDPQLTKSDVVVLENLIRDTEGTGNADQDSRDIQLLQALNDETGDLFQPTVFAGWDVVDGGILRQLSSKTLKDQSTIPELNTRYSRSRSLNNSILNYYIRWASTIVRRPTDIVFLTHVILYLVTVIPSALYLYCNFSWLHGIAHLAMIGYYCGPFTLLLHNHIHNNGVLAKNYAWFDKSFPYILEPLMGHTWDSYFYHHVKHHHVEGNGPEDLSSTIRYQRDEFEDFALYFLRFLALIWIELPLYFLRKKKIWLAIKSFLSEQCSYTFLYAMARYNARATTFVLLLPFFCMRLGMMAGNWGQHCLVDEVEPDSDFRSSITLIDVPSNRYCFNDGWHTSHHLNPRRHWRDHPLAFLKAKEQYKNGRALVFRNIDYIMMTVSVLRKDYDHLARCLVPIGDQFNMSHQEIVEMLRSKTKRFTEEDIQKKFRKA